jgi:hypothetical protein
MPGFDGTGPTGEGTMTGRGQGRCISDADTTALGRPGRGLGRPRRGLRAGLRRGGRRRAGRAAGWYE